MERKSFNLSETKISVRVTCRQCRTTFEIKVVQADYERWQKGELIQRAMPYLSADDRELLISQTCPVCWDKMFK